MRFEQRCRRDALPLGGMDHAVGDELAQRLLVGMLQLAAAAGREMSARRGDMMRARRQRPVGRDMVAGYAARDMAARGGDAVAARGDTLDDLEFAHRNDAMAGLTARARSPAEKAGDAIRAAS